MSFRDADSNPDSEDRAYLGLKKNTVFLPPGPTCLGQQDTMEMLGSGVNSNSPSRKWKQVNLGVVGCHAETARGQQLWQEVHTSGYQRKGKEPGSW